MGLRRRILGGAAMVAATVMVGSAVLVGPVAGADPAPALVLSIVAGNVNTNWMDPPTPGPATASSLRTPDGVAVDSQGNLYIANTGNSLILKVTSAGTLSIFAGSTDPDLECTGGLALCGPEAVAVDASDNVYVADTYANRILKYTPAGAQTVIAGGHGPAAPTPGPATDSALNWPMRMAFDSAGNLYVGDVNNAVVEKITPAGTLSIFAGNGTNSTPAAGPATSTGFSWPEGVAVDSDDNVYISDPGSGLVVKVDQSGTLSIVAGNGTADTVIPGPATSTPLNGPTALAIDASDNLLICNHWGSGLLKVTPSGDLSLIAGIQNQWGNPTPGPALSSSFACDGLAVDSSGVIFAADGNHRLVLKLAVPAATAPEAPTALVATPGTASASIAFTAGADGGATISKYQYSTDGGTNWSDVSAGSSSPVTINGLDNYTAYSIKLRAVNSVGAGAASSAVSVTPAFKAPTSAPPSVGSTRRSILASWALLAPADAGGQVLYYRASVFLAGTNTRVRTCKAGPTETSCEVKGLTIGTAYDVRITSAQQTGSGRNKRTVKSLLSAPQAITLQ